MPAKRLQWFRVWIDATTHGKVRQLDDATFRTWVELLDAAAKQPHRGRFESAKEAISIVRRPPAHIVTLVNAKLIDRDEDGLVMHDWDEWQRWRPEDANDTTPPPQPQRNGQWNNTGTTHERPTNGPAPRAPAGAPASGETETEKDTELTHPPTPSRRGRGRKARSSVDDGGPFPFDPVP